MSYALVSASTNFDQLIANAVLNSKMIKIGRDLIPNVFVLPAISIYYMDDIRMWVNKYESVIVQVKICIFFSA